MAGPTRIVRVEDLPSSLWSTGTLLIPPALASAYVRSVESHGLRALADARDPQRPPVGGLTQAAAEEHFAQAFDGSIARTELTLLDPRSEVAHVADALACFLAGGRVAILDVPSGAGAFTLSLLCTLAELRVRGVVPRMELYVVVVGGEINSTARRYAAELFCSLKEYLASQAIFVEFKTIDWNVCETVSNTALIKTFLADAQGSPRTLVAVSNFSGFLTSAGKQREAEKQLEEVFRFCSGDDSIAVWLEPQTNAATKTLFAWIRSKVRSVWRYVHELEPLGAPTEPATTQAPYSPPLRPDATCVVRVCVNRYNLRAPVR